MSDLKKLAEKIEARIDYYITHVPQEDDNLKELNWVLSEIRKVMKDE